MHLMFLILPGSSFSSDYKLYLGSCLFMIECFKLNLEHEKSEQKSA